MTELKIEYIPIDQLKPYEKNAKLHPPKQVEHIANSIRGFGFRQPLVVDKDNVLVIRWENFTGETAVLLNG